MSVCLAYSITERRVPELIPVLGSQPAGDVSYKPGGRLPLLSARAAVTFPAHRPVPGVNSLPETVTRQRRGCDLNPGHTDPESSTLTTRLPSQLIGCVSEFSSLSASTWCNYVAILRGP